MVKIKSIFIALIFLASCSQNEREKGNELSFYSLSIENRILHVIDNPNELKDSLLTKSLYDSISIYKTHYMLLMQSIEDNKLTNRISISDHSTEDPAEIKVRNIYQFNIVNDSIYAEDALLKNQSNVIDSLTYFIDNQEQGFNYPEFRPKTINLIGDTVVSKHIFIINSILIDSNKYNQVEWQNLVRTIRDIRQSYSIVRNRASKKLFGITFLNLDEQQKKTILELHPFRLIIRFDHLWLTPPPPPPPPAIVKSEIDTIDLERVQVILKQEFPEKGNHIFSCHSTIYILKQSQKIDSLTFEYVEAVGGHFGLRNAQEIDEHLLVTKHGDYDGRTLIINQNGKIFNLIGGQPFIDKEQNLLFSIFDSDLSGFSIFDLKSDSLLLSDEDFSEYPISFHRAFNNRFFITCYNDEDKRKSIWEFEPDLKRVMHVDLDSTQINSSNELPSLTLKK